ncbi:MAG: RluA family pseudouridine synthase, partial [Proteobacteria bacterium]|nr:RluA family pseudouridine synthase [Burkholderiales bacterium]
VGAALGRQALHAVELGFVHPVDAAPMRFSSALPADIAHALAQLRPIE